LSVRAAHVSQISLEEEVQEGAYHRDSTESPVKNG